MAFSSMSLDFNPSTLLLLAAAPLLSYLLIWRMSSGDGRRYHPIAGSTLQMMQNIHRLYDHLTDLSRRHKSFRIRTSPFHSDVYTNDPAVVEHILRTNFDNYVKGTFHYEIFADLFGDGLLGVDGEKWRHQRKLASHEFSTKSLKEISGRVFKKNGVVLAKALSEAADSNRTVDLQDLFMRSTMDSIFEVSFGAELGSLGSKGAETNEFTRALDEANEQVSMRFLDPTWKLKRFFNAASAASLKKNVRVVDDFVLSVIQSKVNLISNEKGENNHDILSQFLAEREKDAESLSDRYLRDIILGFIVAGKDTTAGTLSWFFYLLCRHPAVEERIYSEVREAMRVEDAASVEEFAANFTEESLSKMKYLHAAIAETLRLCPAVPTDGKICVSDDILPDGYAVRAGEFVQFLPYCMGRRKDLWGEDAEIFRPERWLDEEGNFRPESPFKFTAFQAGPRICLGKEFAYRQMKIFSAILIRFYTFKLREEKESVRYKVTLTLIMDPGLNVHVYRR